MRTAHRDVQRLSVCEFCTVDEIVERLGVAGVDTTTEVSDEHREVRRVDDFRYFRERGVAVEECKRTPDIEGCLKRLRHGYKFEERPGRIVQSSDNLFEPV